MSISPWRLIHLALAWVSFLFLALASLTGIILGLAPIDKQLQPHNRFALENISLGSTLEKLNKTQEEILWLEVDNNGGVLASVVNAEGENQEVFINPLTGEVLAVKEPEKALYLWAKTLHRSLFLKSTGRFLIGLTAFVLFFIALSGIFLVSKRQGGFKKWFKPIIKDKFYPLWHALLGRWLLLPILIIALSGSYLSLLQFNLITPSDAKHQLDEHEWQESEPQKVSRFKIFNETMLGDLKRVEFPFSPFPEDYFSLQTRTQHVIINQFSGEIISTHTYPISHVLAHYSMIFHTGQGSWLWSIILVLASIGILFFIYSGFKIMWSRQSGKIKNHYALKDCTHLILVGSEGGTTFNFARALYAELIRLGKRVYLAEMNQVQLKPKLEHLIIMTATYGNGEAPSNAKKFLKQLQTQKPTNKIGFTVLGFGSSSYPYFCAFAKEVQSALSDKDNFKEDMPYTSINNQSTEAFKSWMMNWCDRLNIPARIPNNIVKPRKIKQRQLVCTQNTKGGQGLDASFLLCLKPKGKLKFKSGDLLSIVPPEDQRERLYSIGKSTNNEILIAVKRHEFGLVSNWLYQLNTTDELSAGLVKNKNFHLPKRAKQVIMLATGTGVGPFLGMLQHPKKQVCLYWGGRNQEQFSPYREHLERAQQEGSLSTLKLAFSRETNQEKCYVQDLLIKDATFIADALKNKAVFMICGSVVMQEAVLACLNKIALTHNQKALCYYESRKQLKMDCY
jgi:sulfite reductase (NADPH) flavoprotein alpha-component